MMKTEEIFLSFFFINLEIWFRFGYCGLIGFDLGITDAWHWFVKPLLFLVRVILGKVPMVVFLWFFKFLYLNYLTNLPSLARIFVSCWPIKFILMLRLVESLLVMPYSITFLFCKRKRLALLKKKRVFYFDIVQVFCQFHVGIGCE